MESHERLHQPTLRVDCSNTRLLYGPSVRINVVAPLMQAVVTHYRLDGFRVYELPVRGKSLSLDTLDGNHVRVFRRKNQSSVSCTSLRNC
jgi:hypothetical protein